MTIIRRAADVAIATEIDNTDHLLMEVDGATKRVPLGVFKPEAGTSVYVTRDVFVTAVLSGLSSSVGDVVTAGGLEYRYTGGADISDLPGWSPRGDIGAFKQFGAVGDAVIAADGTLTSGTDDADAIQDAIDWMVAVRGRRLIASPESSYRVTTTITGTGSVAMNLGSAKFICDANEPVFSFSGTSSNSYDLGSDYSDGDLTIDLTGNALPATPKVGQVCKIITNALDPANRDQGSESAKYRVGEYFIVAEGSTTTSIALERPLRYTTGISPTSTAGEEASINSYTTAMNARIILLDMESNFDVTGGEMMLEAGNAAWTASTVEIRGYVGGKWDRLAVSRCYGSGIFLGGTYGFVLNDPNIRNGKEASGYGVGDAGCNTIVRGLSGYDTRHIYTTTESASVDDVTDFNQMLSVGRITGAQIIGGHGVGGSQTIWDTHHGSSDATFRDVHAEGGDEWSLLIRGRDANVSGVIGRNMGKGVSALTEYDSGDADDDYYTNAKDESGPTRAHFSDLDLECAANPIVCNHALMNISGAVRVLSPDHRVLYANGGVLRQYGAMNATILPSGGTNSTGIIEAAATNSIYESAVGTTQMTINGDTYIDARDADATGIVGIKAADDTLIIIRSRVTLRLPAGATLLSTTGEIRCEGAGEIVFSVEGAADNAGTLNIFSHDELRVRALDNTVEWDTVTNAGRTVFYDGNVNVSHAGTGSEVQNVYIPDGQAVAHMMDAAGDGRISFKITGTKIGTNGSATLNVRSGTGNFVHGLIVDQNCNRWEIEGFCDFYGVNTQRHVTTVRDFTDSGTTSNMFSKTNSETEVYSDSSEVVLRLGINAASSDTINIQTCEIWASKGGIV